MGSGSPHAHWCCPGPCISCINAHRSWSTMWWIWKECVRKTPLSGFWKPHCSVSEWCHMPHMSSKCTKKDQKVFGLGFWDVWVRLKDPPFLAERPLSGSWKGGLSESLSEERPPFQIAFRFWNLKGYLKDAFQMHLSGFWNAKFERDGLNIEMHHTLTNGKRSCFKAQLKFESSLMSFKCIKHGSAYLLLFTFVTTACP